MGKDLPDAAFGMKSPSIMHFKSKSPLFLSFLVPDASTLSGLQDGYWELTPELGTLLNFNADLFANVFLKSKGIDSLGENLLDSGGTLMVVL